MTDAVPISRERLVAFSGEHLYYEIDMLYGVTDTLLAGVKDDYVYNALLESFVVHTSTILDFFYKDPMNADDAKAAHYMRDPRRWKSLLPPPSKQFIIFNRKRNKEVVHLSYKRLDVQPEHKRWGVVLTTRQIRKLVDLFLDTAEADFLSPRVLDLHSRRLKWKKRS